MNLKRKIRFVLLMMLLLMLIFTVKASAVSISISTSASSVSAGGTFTATITGSDATGRVNISVTNGTASESSVWVENDSQSVTVTAGSSGTVSISASGELSNSEGTEDKTVSASASVSIATATTTTTDNSGSTSDSGNTSDSGSTTTTTTVTAPVLSNLGITPYDFSGFKSGTTSYSVTVPNECTSVTIYASTNSTDATISGTGAVTLKEGTNKYTVTVSNSAGSKSYTISIVRQSEENEIVANTSEDETTEETDETTSVGIGLDSLTITGYELNEEFDINTYEYTVTLSEEITKELLEEIKEKIFWTANSEDVNVEYEIEALEDGTSGTITLIIKDDEKEYSRYTITFLNSEEIEEEEETTKIGVAGTTSDNNSGTTGGSGLSDSGKKIIGFIICICALAGVGIYFAIHTYIKDRKVADAEEFEETDGEGNENLVESILKAREVEFPKLESDMPENVETISTEKMDALMDDIESLEPESENDLNLEKAKAEELAKDTKEKLAELSGYRKFRKGFSSGKH